MEIVRRLSLAWLGGSDVPLGVLFSACLRNYGDDKIVKKARVRVKVIK